MTIHVKLDDPALQASLAAKLEETRALLRRIADEFSPAVFANSLGAEDMLLTDLIVRDALPIEVFSLDTGRLPPETYALMGEVEQRYGAKLKVYFPETAAVEAYVREQGINSFYASVELRRACCAIRKARPSGL